MFSAILDDSSYTEARSQQRHRNCPERSHSRAVSILRRAASILRHSDGILRQTWFTEIYVFVYVCVYVYICT